MDPIESPVFELRNVVLRRGSHFRLEIPELSIERGKCYSLVGQNGTGKSSLISVLGLLDRVDEGVVLFEGKDILGMNGALLGVRRRIGMVMQEPLMLRGTVFDNISFGLKLRGWTRERTIGRATQCAATVGLEGSLRRKARELSGGEVRRVAIARAIAYYPDLLLLDEPTSSIDKQNAVLIEELIRNILSQNGATVVMTTHDEKQARRMADEILLLEDGRIVKETPGGPSLDAMQPLS